MTKCNLKIALLLWIATAMVCLALVPGALAEEAAEASPALRGGDAIGSLPCADVCKAATRGNGTVGSLPACREVSQGKGIGVGILPACCCGDEPVVSRP